MMKKIILFILLTTPLFYLQGQNITLRDSITGEKIISAFIRNHLSTHSVVSDSSGNFDKSRFNQSDTIIITHLGYKEKRILLSKAEGITLLVPKAIQQEEVEVTTVYEERKGGGKEIVLITDETKRRFSNLGELLKKESSLYIKDYGGEAGNKLISLRGMSSENTIVLFNEARVNDLRTGLFDLSALGTGGIDQIIFVKEGDDLSPYISSGGILKIYSERDFRGRYLRGGYKLSSDLLQSYTLNYRDGNEYLFFILNGERSWSPNNYDFRFLGEEYKRVNAHFNKSFASGNIIYKPGNLKLSLYTNYSYLNSAIPGFVVTNNINGSRAWNINSSSLTMGDVTFSVNRYSFELRSWYNHQRLLLEDPDGILIAKGSGKTSKLNEAASIARVKYIGNSFNISAGGEYSTANLTDITSFVSGNHLPGELKRKGGKIFIAGLYEFDPIKQGEETLLKVLINGKGIYETASENLQFVENENNTSWSGGINLIPLFPFNLNFRVNYSNDYRLPSFNERYYSSLFNHYSLSKEKFRSLSAGFDAAYGETALGFTYFNIEGIDKIIWIPSRLAFQTPRNIGKILSTGIEVSLDQSLFRKSTILSLNYSYTDVKNRTGNDGISSSYNKQLIYIPEHRFNTSIFYSKEDLELALYYNYTGKRYYTSDNDPFFVLPAYNLVDVSAGYNIQLFGKKFNATLTVFNLFNEDYLIIQSYPMPLRNLLLSINLEIL
jgi:vitamin B12 transporter